MNIAGTDQMKQKDIQSYENEIYWKKYQKFFPEKFRTKSEETTPTEEYWNWRGIDVHLDRFEVPKAKFKVIVIHGAGAYARMMTPVAIIAKNNGYSSVIPDLPGYGLTKAKWGKLKYELWIDCIVDLIEKEIARDGIPVVLFGVSMGGNLAYHAAAKSKKPKGIMVTTIADTRERSVKNGFARNKFLGSVGISSLKLLPFLTDRLPMPMAYVSKMNNISNNPDISRICMSDRSGGGNWMPAGFLRTFVGTNPALEAEDFDVCPVLLVHPEKDKMTDIEFSKRFFNRLSGEKKMVILEGAGHMPVEQPGIFQLETACIEFLKDLKV